MDTPPLVTLRRRITHRLIASRYPTTGILDQVAHAADLDAVFELEGWTNDRITTEVGILLRLPRDEWVVAQPMASVVMAAFCHPLPAGGRFNDSERGAWYAAFSLEAAHAEATYRRGRELAEIGVSDARLEMREYVAEFSGAFHDIRADRPEFRPFHDPDDYSASQQLARHLLATGSSGIVYRSVRLHRGICLACFRPRLVTRVRVAGHYTYTWSGQPEPLISRMAAAGDTST